MSKESLVSKAALNKIWGLIYGMGVDRDMEVDSHMDVDSHMGYTEANTYRVHL